MAEAGILKAQDRVELIEGEILQMAAVGVKHAATVKRLNRLFYQRLDDRVLIGVQDPVQLSETSEPQPDLALLKPREDYYATGHPQLPDLFLLVEVADSTVDYDRTIKMPLYAKVGVPEAWLIDLVSRTIEVYRKPQNSGYQSLVILQADEFLSIEACPDILFAVNEILGINP
jgi:Uma2 family endonuclease